MIIEFLKKRYSEHMSFNKLNEVHHKIEETRQILTEDIEKLTERGEKLHLLVDKTDLLTESVNKKKNFLIFNSNKN